MSSTAGLGVITSRASLAIFVPPQRRILNVVRTASVLQQTIHCAGGVYSSSPSASVTMRGQLGDSC